MALEENTILGGMGNYPLHLLGWKAFQDLAISVAEECLRRPVQNFLPTSDAGRDGAFVGRWDGDDPAAGESTIQCKFTSKQDVNLTPSLLEGEISKARSLAEKGLAKDYIILTNHPCTGASEIRIREAFEAVGVGRCRVFGRDWIVRQIKTSPRLRMMAPRLYGLGDLSELMDARAYAQAQLILSSMGEDIQRLVVTDAHRKSVRAISEHNLVLLLGAPAAGKSTIGASIAIGAADLWGSGTIRATSPLDIRRHLDPQSSQFFWIDDAWGNTQYQRQTAEEWNQMFPLMQGAVRRGTRFLITSRDYIWRAAQKDLKLQAMPVLRRSQVVIDVHELTTQERAQILYNHLKMGDQPLQFRQVVKDHLPELAERKDFLPETARRLGMSFFSETLSLSRDGLIEFFEEPEDFLLETISNLSDECRAAIAVVFLNGGTVRSPVSAEDLQPATLAFGVTDADVRVELEALNGSLLLLAQDEEGPYWTYKHPTVSDAFSRYVAGSPEKIEIYLHGARATSLIYEVVCAGVSIDGNPVIVPNSLLPLLLDRMENLSRTQLRTFVSYRSNRDFSRMLLSARPDLLNVGSFCAPIAEDADTSMVAKLHSQGLLPEETRLLFVESARSCALDYADSSFLDGHVLEALLTDDEAAAILRDVKEEVLGKIDDQVSRHRSEWQSDYPPDEHFTEFEESIERFIERALSEDEREPLRRKLEREVSWAVVHMNDDFEPQSSTAAPTSQSKPGNSALVSLFRDIDE